MPSKKPSYAIETVDPQDPRVAEYIQSVATRHPVSHRIIFTKTRVARCRYVVLLTRVSGGGLEIYTVGIGGLTFLHNQTPALLFMWVESSARLYFMDRHLLEALCDTAKQCYSTLLDVTEFLQLCSRITDWREGLINAGELEALGIMSLAEMRLIKGTARHPALLGRQAQRSED